MVDRNGPALQVEGAAHVEASTPLGVAARDRAQVAGGVAQSEGRALRHVENVPAVLAVAVLVVVAAHLAVELSVNAATRELYDHVLVVVHLQAGVAILWLNVVLESNHLA